MTKRPIPLYAEDITPFARALARQLAPQAPSHLALMNMIARAAGFQNIQHMRHATAATNRLARPVEVPAPDARAVERALHQFDNAGCLIRWPAKRNIQTLALWVMWAGLPARQTMSEPEVNRHLAGQHLFNDPATLRRTMIGCGLLTRAADGSDYRRVEQDPTPEAKALIAAIQARRR